MHSRRGLAQFAAILAVTSPSAPLSSALFPTKSVHRVQRELHSPRIYDPRWRSADTGTAPVSRAILAVIALAPRCDRRLDRWCRRHDAHRPRRGRPQLLCGASSTGVRGASSPESSRSPPNNLGWNKWVWRALFRDSATEGGTTAVPENSRDRHQHPSRAHSKMPRMKVSLESCKISTCAGKTRLTRGRTGSRSFSAPLLGGAKDRLVGLRVDIARLPPRPAWPRRPLLKASDRASSRDAGTPGDLQVERS